MKRRNFLKGLLAAPFAAPALAKADLPNNDGKDLPIAPNPKIDPKQAKDLAEKVDNGVFQVVMDQPSSTEGQITHYMYATAMPAPKIEETYFSASVEREYVKDGH